MNAVTDACCCNGTGEREVGRGGRNWYEGTYESKKILVQENEL